MDTNESYEIEVGTPLLRPGLTIRTVVSGRYLAQTVSKLMDTVRDINNPPMSREEIIK